MCLDQMVLLEGVGSQPSTHQTIRKSGAKSQLAACNVHISPKCPHSKIQNAAGAFQVGRRWQHPDILKAQLEAGPEHDPRRDTA